MLANDSILVTPGSGATIATHSVSSKEHQVMMIADHSGHIHGSLPTYFYQSPRILVGANKLWVDCFNASGSGKIMDIRGIWIVPNTAVSSTSALGVRLDFYRTSAVGTGGTAATADSATVELAGGVITKLDENNDAVPAQITFRAEPSGGATISRWMFPMIFQPTTTAIAPNLAPGINWVPEFLYGQKLVAREGQGFLIKQNAVAANPANANILIAFTLE
jgi:hypothetical protein